MFEALQAAGAAWRTITHISEWTGLSLGALAACGAVLYFEPAARQVAIGGAVAVGIGWTCLVHGHAVGVADRDAQLKILSDQGDARAAASAKADESALVADIQQKAKKQHDEDLAEIARLK